MSSKSLQNYKNTVSINWTWTKVVVSGLSSLTVAWAILFFMTLLLPLVLVVENLMEAKNRG